MYIIYFACLTGRNLWKIKIRIGLKGVVIAGSNPTSTNDCCRIILQDVSSINYTSLEREGTSLKLRGG